MGFFDDDRENLGPPPEPFRFGGGDREFRSPVPLKWIGIAAAALVAYITLNVLKSIYVDVLWFDSVGFAGVFRTVIFAKIALFLVGAAITTAVVGANIWVARRYAPRGPEESFIEDVDPVAIRRIVSVLLVAGTLFMAVIFGAIASGAWETILVWLNGVSFGQSDAQFGRDASFYLFDLPAYHFIQGWLLGLVVVSALGAAAVYGLSASLQRFELRITRGMRIHLSILVGIVFLLLAVSTYLSIFGLVVSPGGFVFGATFTDVHARLPVRYLLVALAAFAGLATVANAFLSPNGYRVPIFAVGIWAFAGIVGGLIYPNIVQSVQVEPNQREKEAPYIARNIEATRFAYGLDGISELPFPANPRVTAAEFDSHPKTLDNVRLLDPLPLRDTFNQIQAIRQFYVFADVDVDRYTIDGQVQQVMIAARELDITKAQDRNWTRERLQLTHGFGAVVSPVNKVGSEGLPQLLTQDIPPRSEVLPISTDGARIYFGELTNQYVIGNSEEPEFDYPLGEGNAETHYAEDRGIRLNSFVKRFALAWELGDTSLLISGRINSDSRLLMRRNIQDRVSHVAPFLTLDSDPYLVIDGEQLMWIVQAYTTSHRFPYSQPSGGINYIRHSVVITVDAQTGDMDFYLTGQSDPVVETWAKIFPDLFKPNATMPQSVRDHLRYPLDMFKLQSTLYLRYHITDPSVFFIGEDVWNIPTEKFRSQEQQVEPYYVLMTLPGSDPDSTAEGNLEFVLIMPFTPRNRQNTVAWLAGRSDGSEYMQLRAYRFPTDELVFGPAQIEARIDQNPGISQQITLWDQSGSEVIRGNLLMIPVGSSFLFVEPIYLQAENSRLPELVRVVAATGNSIAMEQTLPEAIDVLLGRRPSSLPNVISPGGGTTTPGETPTPTPAATATAQPGSLQELLDQARQASDSSQAELERLRALLDEIQRRLNEQTP